MTIDSPKALRDYLVGLLERIDSATGSTLTAREQEYVGVVNVLATQINQTFFTELAQQKQEAELAT